MITGGLHSTFGACFNSIKLILTLPLVLMVDNASRTALVAILAQTGRDGPHPSVGRYKDHVSRLLVYAPHVGGTGLCGTGLGAILAQTGRDGTHPSVVVIRTTSLIY